MQRKNVLALCNVQFKHVTTQGCNYYIWQFFSFSAAAELFGFVVAASVPNDQKNMRGVFAVLITMPWGVSAATLPECSDVDVDGHLEIPQGVTKITNVCSPPDHPTALCPPDHPTALCLPDHPTALCRGMKIDVDLVSNWAIELSCWRSHSRARRRSCAWFVRCDMCLRRSRRAEEGW